MTIHIGFTLWLLLFIAFSATAGTYTVTNTNNSGGGSLNRAISDVNSAGAGPHTIQFAIDTTDPNYSVSRGVFTITLTSLLPVLTRDDVTIDATTQAIAFGNTNPGQLGTGGTVGVDSLALSTVPAPEIEIVDGAGLERCFEIRADNVTVRGFAIYGFGNIIDNVFHGAIILGEYSNVYSGGLIELNILGTPADTLGHPGPGNESDGYGVSLVEATGCTVQNNIVAFHGPSGLSAYEYANNNQFLYNEVFSCGLGTFNYDGIGLGNYSYNSTVVGNLLYGNGAVGVDLWQCQGGITVENNSIKNNGQSLIVGQEESGIRLFGTGNTVTKNILENNNGPGVLIPGLDGSVDHTPCIETRISQNYFIGNEKNAIDLSESGSDVSQGDGITGNNAAPAACGTVGTSGNQGLDYPVIDSAAFYSGTGLTTVGGRACPNSTIEFYTATSGSGDSLSGNPYGEGTFYIDSTTTNGSGSFVKNISGLDSSNSITAIVIDANDNTSEFSENLKVYFVPEDCSNGIDDDADGLVDCQDTLDCRPSTPGAITPSNAAVCGGQAGETYSISSLPDATSYTWSVPTGATITAGQGTTSIAVTWGVAAGDVCVTSTNGFCNSAITCIAVVVTNVPVAPVSVQH